ncbi:hypothetical protein [Telluribacter sp.]|jgi:hypothetical protein|uniref:hypothetical protein n=1 Tax=Telluribacter sp. TaxID=1978767 RepID=UPI002E132F76|nr:hypothetical protein [Telluribacter sp.]
MEEKNQSGIIPENYTGKIIDTTSFVDFESTEDAKAFFEVVKQRLLDVNSWYSLSGTATAEFQVVDNEGTEVNRPVQEGDFFKIDVPGPGPVAGDGYDWVRVEEIKSVADAGMESVGIRVRPTTNPQNNDDHIAHFYSEESTSNFTVTREGNRITAGIYDRNTKPNHDSGLADKARDLVVGLGAVTGFSKFQWQKLADGLLKKLV